MDCLIFYFLFGNKHFLEFFIENILSIKELLEGSIFGSINGINYYEIAMEILLKLEKCKE